MTRALVLGGTGALGEVIAATGTLRDIKVIASGRSAEEWPVDLSDAAALDRLLEALSPDVVINCAAQVDLGACEADPAQAYAVNARPAASLAEWSWATGRPFVQISTDQFFNDGPPGAVHAEDAPVTLLNEYARTKFAGEAFALEAPGALVVRTNMAAARPGRTKTSIAAWAFDQIAQRAPLKLFTDYHCSTLDAPTLASAVWDLVDKGATGRVNVASAEPASKWAFVHALAESVGVSLDWARPASAMDLTPRRALNTGLDVSRAEALLGRPLPGLKQVAANFAAQRGAV